MANIAINILVLGASGFLAVPAVKAFFEKPAAQDKITIHIGVGATNSSAPVPGEDLAGDCPMVELYDVNGKSLGSGRSDAHITDGGSAELTIDGDFGSGASVVPEYLQLSAPQVSSNAVCISWFSTSSAVSTNGDFRSWTAGAGKFCGMPWYPSVAQFPTLSEHFQPPCVWIGGHEGRFPVALSVRLTDFFFPGPDSNKTAEQWTRFPDTLCKAPARQQFYSNMGTCIPFYPSGLSIINEKDPDTGFDADFSAVQSSFTKTCSVAGLPWNIDEVDLGGESQAVKPTTIGVPDGWKPGDAFPTEGLNSAVTVPLNVRDAPTEAATVAEHPAVTPAARLPEPKKRPPPRHEPVLDRRVENRAQRPDEWCHMHQLVVSEHVAHSAADVCGSETSWGPDFVAQAEGLYCDMCERKVYPLCGRDTEVLEKAARHHVEGVSSRGAPGTCFDLDKNQLREPAAARFLRREERAPVKTYQRVKYWK